MTVVEDPEVARGEVTRLLASFQGDRDAATDELLPHVYGELRRLAASKLGRESAQQTLQPTALVHEAYLRLVGAAGREAWQNRRHFFGAAAEAMRRILVDSARAKSRLKRTPPGGGLGPEPQVDCGADANVDLIVLDDALSRLEAADPSKAELVKLKFFGGFTTAEAAEALGLSLRSAEREWAFARVWLHREMGGGDALD